MYQLGNSALLDEWLIVEESAERRAKVLEAFAGILADPTTADSTSDPVRRLVRIYPIGGTGLLARCLVVEQFHTLHLQALYDGG